MSRLATSTSTSPDGVSTPITTPCAPASLMVATSRSMAATSYSS
jgi:hypothetical protein